MSGTRKAFEAIIDALGHSTERRADGDYANSDVELAYAIWQEAAHRAAPQWLPISTAPRDGTDILGWRDDCGVMLIRWTAPIYFMTEREIEASSSDDDEWMNAQDWYYADFVSGGRLDGSEAPTHWMPLPAAPEQKP